MEQVPVSESPSSESAPVVRVSSNASSSRGITFLAAVVGWLAGINLATGAGAVLATIFPPYGWYLVVAKLLQVAGLQA